MPPPWRWAVFVTKLATCARRAHFRFNAIAYMLSLAIGLEENSDMPLNRRTMLIAGTGALLTLSHGRAHGQKAQGQPLMGDPVLPLPAGERMRWAVVGLGTFAVGQILPAFGEAGQSRLTAFVSGTPDKARQLGAAYGVDRFYSYETYDQIADDPEIDCVYIALPVGLHADYTIRALNAGKHVLCEKPMASTSAECAAMIAAAKKAGKTLGVAYRVHFEPTNLIAREIIANDGIGAMRHIRCEHGFDAQPQWPPHKWRLEKVLAGGGSMFDIGIYGLNTALMMLGDDRPVSISAVYVYPRDDARFREVEGGIDWRMTMASGAVVSGSSSYCFSPFRSEQSYIGSGAALWMSPATTYYENDLVRQEGGRREHLSGGSAHLQFPRQLDGFSAAAKAGTAHLTPGEMGLRDIRLIEAAYRSADQGGTPVALTG